MGINRNIVECKLYMCLFAVSCECTVLIETLWNVNDCSIFSTSAFGSRINRNIVECKYITMHTSRMCRARGINRNIVECKCGI